MGLVSVSRVSIGKYWIWARCQQKTVFSRYLIAGTVFVMSQQLNEVQNSNAMELEDLKRCISFIESNSMTVSTIVTDQHIQIEKYLQEERPDIIHYTDPWHLVAWLYVCD